MSTSASQRRLARAIAAVVLSLTVLSFTPAGAAHADTSLTVITPWPAVETQPGQQVKLDFSIASAAPEVVDLKVGTLPDGWTATLRGGGFVVHSVTSKPPTETADGAKVTLELDVAPTTPPGEYPVQLTATDQTGGRVVSEVTLAVLEQVNSGIGLTADFPSLTGDPGSAFTYKLTVTNDTPTEQTFTFDPTAPQGWTVTASPTAESRAETVTVDAGGTSDVNVTATPPGTADAGEYPIDVAVQTDTGLSGTVSLTAEVVGTPSLQFGTADQRLNVSGTANSEQRIPMVVANTGSAPLEAVKLAGTAPSGWDVAFDPQQVDSVQPGETAQVTAVVKPSSDSVAGDYSLTVRASAGSANQSVDLRYTLKGSAALGAVAIGVIVVAVAALAGVFLKFGRR